MQSDATPFHVRHRGPQGERRESEPAPRRWARAIARLTVVGVVGVAATVTVLRVWSTSAAASVVGSRAFAVTSGSMTPTFEVGDMVVVRDATPSRLSAVEMGDIITYRRRSTPGLLVTHRVVRVIDTPFGPTFLTRGDANDDVDTVPTRSSDVVGIYSGRIPRGGSLALAVAGVPFGLLVLALVLALVVLGTGKGRMRITRGNRPKDPINRQRKEMGK